MVHHHDPVSAGPGWEQFAHHNAGQPPHTFPRSGRQSHSKLQLRQEMVRSLRQLPRCDTQGRRWRFKHKTRPPDIVRWPGVPAPHVPPRTGTSRSEVGQIFLPSHLRHVQHHQRFRLLPRRQYGRAVGTISAPRSARNTLLQRMAVVPRILPRKGKSLSPSWRSPAISTPHRSRPANISTNLPTGATASLASNTVLEHSAPVGLSCPVRGPKTQSPTSSHHRGASDRVAGADTWPTTSRSQGRRQRERQSTQTIRTSGYQVQGSITGGAASPTNATTSTRAHQPRTLSGSP
jgi:hypothetical protein